MDCLDARTYFPLLTLSLLGESSAELLAAQRHLEHCAACRSALRQEAAGDLELSRQMSNICIPDGMSERLFERIVAQQALLPTIRPSKTGRRSRLWAAGAAALILALVGPLLVQTFSPASISQTDLLSIIEQSRSIAHWPVDPVREFPLGWSSSSKLITQPFRSTSEASVLVYAADFQFRPGRGAPAVSGTLWRVEARDLLNAGELPPLEAAEIQYGPARELLMWRENGFVYIVALDGRGLHPLRVSLLRSRSLA